MGSSVESGEALKRPATVTYAVCLMCGILIVGAASTVVNLITGQMQADAVGPLLLIYAGAVIIFAVMAYAIWTGLNWARILYAVFAVASLWSWLPQPRSVAMQPARTALFAVTSLMDLVVVTLLFLPVSNAWFRSLRAAQRETKVKAKRKPQQRLWLDRWLAPYMPKTLILSLVTGLILAWVAGMLAAATWAGMDSFLGMVAVLYSMTCFPVQIALLAAGAGLGAWIGKCNGDLWRGATLGAWIAIAVAMMVGLVGGLALRNSNW